MSDNLSSNPKLFAGDTSLFSVVHHISQSGINLNNDLEKISNWVFQWTISFKPDINKQTQEVTFSSRFQKSNHLSLTFNGTQSEIQKYLGMFLDSKLDFKEHKQNVLNKVSKTIELLRKLQKVLPRPPLITAYKSFIRSYLDYGDIIYDQAYNVSFLQKIESIQCNAALATRGAIRETSREKLYHELGFESFVSKRSYRKLCSLYKVFKTQSPRYLFEVIPTAKRAYITRNNDKLPHFKVKHNYFKNYFFPSTVTKWNKLDLNIRIPKVSLVSKVKLWNLYVLPKIVSFFVIIQKEYNY